MKTDRLNRMKRLGLTVVALVVFLVSCKPANNVVNNPNTSEAEYPNSDEKPGEVPGNGALPIVDADEPEIDGEEPEGDPDETGDEPDNTTKPPKKDSDEPAGNKPGSNGNGNKPAEPSIYNDPALSTYWELIDDVVTAAHEYYTENFSKTRVVTSNGYLYNKAAEQKIDVEYLLANGYITSSRYLNKDIEVLLIDAADLSRYDSFRLKSSENSLTVVASIPHPTENSYLLTTSRSQGGALSASQYAALLNSYYQNHGATGKLFPGSDEYNRILDFISMYESKYDSYYVRSITADNRYAMVVLSGQTNAADVKQYVMKKNGGIWEVALSGLESDPRVIITVNKALPDFNLDILPAYTINDHKTGLNKDKSDIINQMTAKGFIENSGSIRYICGTSNYCYVVLNNELKYLCSNTGESWNIVQVASSDEAERKMLAISSTAPTFIIWDR